MAERNRANPENEVTNKDRSPNVDVWPNARIVRSPLDEIKAIQTLLADVYKDAGDGRTLFRELVQNADDAGARWLRLAVLERGWPDARNSLLRGPALLVANDGPFPDKDSKALHYAIGGSKEDDASKIGTFGIGLKISATGLGVRHLRRCCWRSAGISNQSRYTALQGRRVCMTAGGWCA